MRKRRYLCIGAILFAMLFTTISFGMPAMDVHATESGSTETTTTKLVNIAVTNAVTVSTADGHSTIANINNGVYETDEDSLVKVYAGPVNVSDNWGTAYGESYPDAVAPKDVPWIQLDLGDSKTGIEQIVVSTPPGDGTYKYECTVYGSSDASTWTKLADAFTLTRAATQEASCYTVDLSDSPATLQYVLVTLDVPTDYTDCWPILNEIEVYQRESVAAIDQSVVTEKGIYLSDLDWEDGSYNGWDDHDILKDQNYEDCFYDGNLISLLIDEKIVAYDKGLTAHAPSKIYYDISSYSSEYTRFYANLGVDASRGGNGSVIFKIQVSNDMEKWVTLYTSAEIESKSDSYKTVDLNIAGYNYLCLEADANGSNAADHSVYADARLLTSAYDLASDAVDPRTSQGVYLSDLPVEKESSVGYETLHNDGNMSNGKISVMLEGMRCYFDKGVTAHATSTVYYDIADYVADYPKFIAKIGVDASQSGKGLVSFKIYGVDVDASGSKSDSTTWTELQTLSEITSADNAYEVELPLVYTDTEGTEYAYEYLILYADKGTSDAQDHSVYADARLVEADYEADSDYWDGIHRVGYYDDILSQNTYDYNYTNNQYTILQREFVNRMGYIAIQQTIANSDHGDELKETLTWLLKEENLKLFIETGTLENSINVLEALNTLYQEYKDSIDEVDVIYKKILIALGISYGSDVIAKPAQAFFSHHYAAYDIIERYEMIKNMYDGRTAEGVSVAFARKEEFTNYHMELIRMVVNNYLPNDEFNWFRAYCELKFPITSDDSWNWRLDMWNYLSYTDANYDASAYAYADYDAKYYLSQYSIPDDGDFRTWMVLEHGGICWNMSRISQTIHKSHGIASVGGFQPVHEIAFVYSEDSNGNGIWGITNNIFGWGQAYSHWDWITPYRFLFGWGSDTEYAKHNKNDGAYMLLGQAALNDYENYEKSFYYNLLANSYSDSAAKLDLYEQSLTAWNKNLDTYLDIIELYIELDEAETITAAEWYDLAFDITEIYTYYPATMVDLLDAIEPYLEDGQVASIDLLENTKLKAAQNATSAVSLQDAACREIAGILLGNDSTDFATFSFDGENAGKIVLDEAYHGIELHIKYRLDGLVEEDIAEDTDTDTDESTDTGLTEEEYEAGWIEVTVTDGMIDLNDQIDQITAETDIQLQIVGVNAVYTIDILDGEAVDSYVAVSDYENTLVGSNDNALLSLEYSVDGGTSWTDYTTDTKFEGAQTISLRYKAHGVYLQGPSSTYSFTEHDSQGGTYVYIPISELSYVSAAASHDGQAPENMLDANPFTVWHTEWGQQAADMSYVMKFVDAKGNAVVKQFSGFSYEASGGNGTIKNFVVYTSTDGETWTEVGSNASAWGNGAQTESFKLDESIATVYVKIEAVNTYTGGTEDADKYVSGKNFNFFEDITVTPCAAHTDADADNICDTCNMDLCITADSDLEEYSLTLQGDIGVNFHMSLSDDVLALAAEDLVYMHFILPGEEQKDLYVPFDETNCITGIDENGEECTYYTFSCDVNAREMTQDIQAALLVNGISGVGYTYSIKDYADYIRANSSEFSEETVALATAMLNYGASAQTHFAYALENLANADLTDEEKAQVDVVTAVKATDDSGETTYTITYDSDETTATKTTSGACAGTLTGIEYYGSSTLGKAETTLRHYFVLGSDADIAAYSAQYGDAALAFKHENTNIYYVDIENIPADQFGNGYTVTISSSAEADAGLTVTYSVYDYIAHVLTESYFDENMKNVARAMCLYGIAAENYEASFTAE